MMALLLKGGWRILSSRLGLVAVACGLLWGWHVYDKRQAIDAALDGYVLESELSAAKAQLEAIRARAAAAETANAQLQAQLAAAEAEALEQAAELEAFERETTVNPDGVVDGDLLRRLRNQ